MDSSQLPQQPGAIDISKYEKEQRQNTLNIILVIIMSGSVIFGIVNFFYYHANKPASVFFVTGILCLPTIWLNQKGYHRLTGFITSFLVFFSAFFNLFDGAGIRDPGVVAYPIIILIGGILFGRRAILVYTAIGIISLVLVVVLDSSFGADADRLFIISVLLLAGAGATRTVLANTNNNINLLKASEENLRQALEQSRKYGQRINSIIETVPEGVLLLNSQHQVILTNENALAFLAVLAPEHRTETDAVLKQIGAYSIDELIRNSSEGRQEIIVQEPERIFETAVCAVEKVPSPFKNWVLVLRDVTLEHKQQAMLQEQVRLATVGQLASGIAHDFRNILSVISTYSQIAQIRSGEPKQIEYQTIIQDQVKDAARLIEQILDFGRQTIMQRQAVDATDLIENTVKLLKRTLPSNLTITLFQEPGNYIIHADKTRLQQALMNLAVNARDAMPDGGDLQFILSKRAPPEQIRLESENETAVWLTLQVKDSGQGIQPEAFKHIFEPFFTTKDPTKGTGLGLAQVYGIVKQLDGEITVESTRGEGTIFTLYFPIISEMVTSPDNLRADKITIGREIRILLVEDNLLTRQSTEEMLKILGCQVIMANNGKEALSLYQQQEAAVDLVISDIIMPEMGGIALYQALKQITPTIKMLILSGYPLNNQTQELLEQTQTDWIQKPYQAEDLAQKIVALVGDKA